LEQASPIADRASSAAANARGPPAAASHDVLATSGGNRVPRPLRSKGVNRIMATFPRREADIVALARDIATGLAEHPEMFPAPPHSPEEIRAALDDVAAAHDAAVLATAQSKQATAAKDDAIATLVDLMKTDLRYGESITRQDGGKLELLGWGAPRQRTATGLPGQVRTLELLREGKDWLFLDWKEPVDGGQPAAYKVQRRKPGATDWTDVGMAVESEITLNGQEPGVEFEYRVIAANRAGEGPASNTVRAVL